MNISCLTFQTRIMKVFYQVVLQLNKARHSASQTCTLDLSDLKVLHRKRYGVKNKKN